MSTLRRLVLVPVAAAVTFGLVGIAPAYASFGDSTAAPAMQVTTATVAAPGNFTGSLTCTRSGATMAASWSLSGATKVSGYLVTVYFSDGYAQTVSLGSTATSWSAPIDLYNVTAYSVQYSVTTQTSYGWTKESVKTGWFHC